MKELMIDAYDKYMETEEGRALAQTYGPQFFNVFKAGWNAARAEARSDANTVTGGRFTGWDQKASAGDLRDPLTPDRPSGTIDEPTISVRYNKE